MKKQLPIYLGMPIDDMDRSPCKDCRLERFNSACRHQKLTIFSREGVTYEEGQPVDLLVVGDAPSFGDHKAKKFLGDESGQSLLRSIRRLEVDTFAILPSVRCYPGGDIDHNVLTKKYKNKGGWKPRETPLEIATAAAVNCKQYVKRAIVEFNPKVTMAMGPLAAKALDLTGSIPQLRTKPLRPKQGLRGNRPTEGTVVTFDRFAASTNDWVFRDLIRDIKKIKNIQNTGFANPRGDEKTATIITLDTVEKVEAFVDDLLTSPCEPHEVICFDFETASLYLSKEANRILNVGFSRSSDENTAWVVPLAHPETPFSTGQLKRVHKALKRLFYSEGAQFYGWCGHNTQFEISMVKLFFGVWLGEGGGVKTLDTLVLAYELDEDRMGKGIDKPYRLETLAQEMLDFRWYAQSYMKSKRDRLESEPLTDVNTYVGYDAVVTARLLNELLERMQEEGSSHDLLRLATKLYGPAEHYTTDLRVVGQLIDFDLLRKLRAPDSSIVHRVKEIEEIFQGAPEVAEALSVINTKAHGGTGMKTLFKSASASTFSLTSDEHRKALFWDVLQLDGADESVDKKFQERHKNNKLVALFAEYQSLSKLESSYLEPLAKWLQSPNSVDGRVRPNFNLVNTKTGRLSASEPNCYDPETEILTKRGWVPFPDLRDEDEVAQWWPSGQIDFVRPAKVVRQHWNGEMVHLKNQHIDLMVTPNHRCPLRHRKSGKLKVTTALTYQEDYKQHHAGVWTGGTRAETGAMLSFICAAQADGSWRPDVKQGAMELSFTKKRKIERLRAALTDLSIPFTENPKADGRRFYVSNCDALQYVLSVIGQKKEFSIEWLLSLDRASLSFFVEEVNHWDGCFTRNNQYTSVIKQNVDAVQIAMTLSGLRATVNRHSSPLTPAWAIYQTNRDYSMTTNVARERVLHDGMIYCVAVPSTFVVVRRNGFTAISGNTQQLPRGDSVAKKQIKALFKAPDNRVLIQLDFSQAEVRWLGILSGDENLAEKYRRADEIEAELLLDPTNEALQRAKKIDGDLHMSTAIDLYHLDPNLPLTDEKQAKLYRQRAKATVFGLIYGKTAKSLAKDLGIEEEEAEEAIELWMGRFPKAAAWLTKMEDFCEEHGYVKSAFGRWRRLPEVQSANQSIVNRAKRQSRNTPIQSAASDCCIYAACKLRDAIRLSDDEKLREVKLINTVHDSLVAEAPADPDVIRAYCKLAKSIFTDGDLLKKDFGIDIIVPLAVDFDIGVNWGNMVDYDFTEKSLARALHDAEVLRQQPSGTLLSDLKGKGLLFDEKKGKAAA